MEASTAPVQACLVSGVWLIQKRTKGEDARASVAVGGWEVCFSRVCLSLVVVAAGNMRWDGEVQASVVARWDIALLRAVRSCP